MSREHPAEDELGNARQQLQIYDAIVIAAHDAHAVLDTMLIASDPDAARRSLEDRYGFTETQSWAVMDVQFRRLTVTDRLKIERRHQELAAQVAVLEEDLGGA